MKPQGNFTSSLWEAVQDIYTALINHPFVNQLAEGTLLPHCFAHYLSQDILYIRDDSYALEKLSDRAPTTSEQDFFKSLASDGILIEQELHHYFLKHFNVAEAEKKSPVIDKYTHFLIDHSEKSSYCIAATALLPCFWVYNEVGKHIITHTVKNNVYQKWIDTYRGGEYEVYTKNFIQLVERLAEKATENERKLMREAFVKAAEFELRFFEESISKQ